MGVVNTLARTQSHKTIQVHFLPYITLLSNSTSQKVGRMKGTQDSQDDCSDQRKWMGEVRGGG